MSLPSFVHLPREVHLLIGRHLQPSEMEGLILSSRHMRVTYCQAFYHSLAFRVSPRRSQPAHYPGNDPRRQACHVRVRARTTITRAAGRGIQLDLWWFSDAQREELRNKCVALPVWTGLRSIQMEEADPELLAVLASKTRAESFSGLQLEGQLNLQAARRSSTPAGVHNNSEMLLDFGRLEWLVLAPVQLPVGGMEAVRADPKLFVRALVKDVSSLRHLERLGLAFPRAILVAHQPGVPGTGTGQPAAPGTQILPQHHNTAASQNLIRAHRTKI
ncbi:hypothetical protein NOF04DRAFT_1339560 [Fusarium oxysporum II5]|nr:hypothetical protein DER44DRAFT_804216 [Fusarium oxysporum]KAK2137822.1 hypothetical protein NOF04DRAFT_1339560 [Fusarium oxysporum II5]